MIGDGFVYLDAVVPGARWDAKYATSDNFTGAPVDGYLINRVIGAREVGDALINAAALAKARGWGLFLWDGYRPTRAVSRFLQWAAEPEDGKTKKKHYPHIDKRDMVRLGYVAARSGHSRGGAIDLTLYDLITGELCDMGGDFDFMDERSHHGAKGVSDAAARYRETLAGIMEACGFARYDSEWWHYSLTREPYPDTYFDFPVE